MSKLSRFVFSFVLILLPILFVYGMIRVAYLGYPVGSINLDTNNDNVIGDITFTYGEVFPSWQDLLLQFSKFPKVEEYVLPAIKFWNDATDALMTTKINDISSFFASIGNSFQVIGAVFYVGAMYISYPFAIMGYVFSTFFVPYGA